ncbi:MAG: stage II sporulation protein P [Oscillospiraceae bacterium]
MVLLLFCSFVALLFLGGGALYFTQNGTRLLQGALGVSPPPEASPTPLPATPSPAKEVQLFIEGKESPVDFLAERLPVLTPDPERKSHPVQETLCLGGKPTDNFFVNDTSDTDLDLAAEAAKALPFQVEDFSQPTVLLYHTHSCEGYKESFTGFYYTDDSCRSSDPEKNVSVVGEAMKAALEERGIGVIHDTTIHDSPAFNGAYYRSMDTVNAYLTEYPSIRVTIDLHRDSMTTDEGLSYKPTLAVEGKKAAQIMIITGSDPTGELEFPSWQENLIFALKLQKKSADLYPDLMRPLMFCQRVYNMNATNASLIFEVGTEMNTIAEAKYSGKLMGGVLGDVLRENNGES